MDNHAHFPLSQCVIYTPVKLELSYCTKISLSTSKTAPSFHAIDTQMVQIAILQMLRKFGEVLPTV